MMLKRLRERLAPKEARTGQGEGSADYPHVELYFWRPSKGLNFGDYLASVIVQRMLATRERVADEPVTRSARLLSLGSVLHFANTGDTIWGTGRNGKIPDDRHRFDSLDVRAVRGPRTRAFLHELGIAAPPIYGDPALLLPRLFSDRFVPAPVSGRIGLICNLNDPEPDLDGAEVLPLRIDPCDHWAKVIDDLLSCEHVVSSSLHGLVIADAYGIPCSHLRLSDIEPDFKYHDYFEGMGRTDYWTSHSYADALQRGALPKSAYDSSALFDAFPIELWD